jgi:hypothetical protein
VKTKREINGSGAAAISVAIGARDAAGPDVIKNGKGSTPYPEGSIGAHIAKRNYIKYLVERYHRCREADANSGGAVNFQYSTLFMNIESKFKAPTYFIAESRFGEVVDFLQNRIDNTLLGRLNRKRGISNYESFDEYMMTERANG